MEHADAEHCASAGEEGQEYQPHNDRRRRYGERQIGDAHHYGAQVDGLGGGHTAGQPDAEKAADRVTDPAGQDDERHGDLRRAQAVLQPGRCVGEHGEERQRVHEVGQESCDRLRRVEQGQVWHLLSRRGRVEIRDLVPERDC